MLERSDFGMFSTCCKCNKRKPCIFWNFRTQQVITPIEYFNNTNIKMVSGDLCYECYQMEAGGFTFEKGVSKHDGEPYFTTWLGHRMYPCQPDRNHYDIRDIAHSLSIVRRYGGHTNKGYSSGQHSLLVAKYAPQPFKFRALLHDAGDAIVGDMVSPLKHHPELKTFVKYEDMIQQSIYKAYGLSPVMDHQEEEIIKTYDLAALAAEARCLTNHSWWQKIPQKDIITEYIVPLEDEAVEHLFLREFDRLYKERLSNEEEFIRCCGSASGVSPS
jgi:5'-nucleotidase